MGMLFCTPKQVFDDKASESELNVSCVAKAKNIDKYSPVSSLHPKVPISIPEISVVGQVTLVQPVKILSVDSLPITYTLVMDTPL